MRSLFYGTFDLMKFVLRKERISTAIWLGVLLFLTIFVAIAYGGLYSDAQSAAMIGMVEMWANPAVVAMLGPIFGEASPASLYASSMILTMVITVAIMNIFFVIRHTRAEEEKGQGEVIRSLPVGRLANLAAVLSFAGLMNLALSILIMFALWGFYGVAGAAMFGFSIGVSGFVFAGVAAIFANLSASRTGAIGMSIGAVLFFYMVRAMGDVSAEWLSFTSPIGLAAQTQPMAGNIAWPLFVLLGIGIICIAVAFYLNSIRDFGRGIFAEKTGRREGGFLMKSPEGLLFKLTRRSTLFWCAGLFMLGASYGVVMGETESFLEMIQTVMPNVTDVRIFIVMITMLASIMAVVPSLAILLKLVGDEKNGRYEQVFAGSVSRHRMLAAHIGYALIQSFVMLFVVMFGLWVTSYSVMDEPIAFGEMFSAFMVYLPASFVFIGLTALLIGLIPKRAAVIMYSYFGLTFTLMYFGPMADLPKEMTYITPFGFVPQIPIDTVNPWAIVSLLLVSAALIAGSFFLYRRRSLRFAA